MNTRSASILAFAAALAVAIPVAGCAEEETTPEGVHEVVEGEPLEIGEISYNVAITRFLNANTTEDAAYLEGMPEEPEGKSYLGVFVLLDNESDEEDVPSAGNYAVTDASHRVYEPLDSTSPFALETGQVVPAGNRVPEPGSIAASGPTQGSLLLFLVDDDVSEERPLELEITSVLGKGVVELDI